MVPIQKFQYFLLFLVIPFIGKFQVLTPASTDSLSRMERKAFEGKLRPLLSAATNNYNFIYARCNWKVDPAVNYIKGDITTYFKPETGSFSIIEFDLSSLLKVDSVIYHGASVTFSHFSNHLLKINLPASVPQGVTDSIRVFYQGVPSTSGFGSFNQSKHGNDPIIWTLSEPYGARDWWPCKQNLSDKIDSIDILVTCPPAFKAASNGLLVSEITSGADKVCHWKSRYPIATYLVAIAITNYTVFTQTLTVPSGTLPIINYVYPENLSSAINETKGIIEIMQLFDSLLIPYPFSKEKYGHAQFGWGGGMEHQTMSFMFGFDYALMAHECAHQWFGDHVTTGSWQEIWLNEGFATYLEGLTVERYKPQNWYQWKFVKARGITSLPGGSVLCDDTTTTGRIFDSRLTYDKGAYLLHMLRWKLGDKAFFDGLKNYLTNPQTAQKFGKTSLLKTHLEATSGQNLGAFFNQWYFNQGYPSYDVEWKNAGNTITVTIEQTTSHQTVNFFEMPVPIRFSNETRDTIIRFEHTFSGQQFTCTIPFAVTWVDFDPELRLLSKDNHVSVLFDLSSDKDLIKVFPNPTEKNLRIRMMIDAERIQLVEVIDGLGKTVMKQLVPGSQNRYDLDVSSLPDAVYYVNVKTSRNNYRAKFIKR